MQISYFLGDPFKNNFCCFQNIKWVVDGTTCLSTINSVRLLTPPKASRIDRKAVLNLDCTLESPNAFTTTDRQVAFRPFKSESLGIGPRHEYFLKPRRRFYWVEKCCYKGCASDLALEFTSAQSSWTLGNVNENQEHVLFILLL